MHSGTMFLEEPSQTAACSGQTLLQHKLKLSCNLAAAPGGPVCLQVSALLVAR